MSCGLLDLYRSMKKLSPAAAADATARSEAPAMLTRSVHASYAGSFGNVRKRNNANGLTAKRTKVLRRAHGTPRRVAWQPTPRQRFQ